jgi:hypothetical protein
MLTQEDIKQTFYVNGSPMTFLGTMSRTYIFRNESQVSLFAPTFEEVQEGSVVISKEAPKAVKATSEEV